MKLSLNWLKEYVDIEMSAHELGELLTMLGLEVEEIQPFGQGLEDIAVARLLSVRPHPRADRLSVCLVDAGGGKEVQVVCGAPNLEEGALVPLALNGVRLPGGRVVEKTEIRGESSEGMLLAEDEMGLTDDHTGIMLLPGDLVPGRPLSSSLPLSDWVLDVEITPNRPDCASVLGIAREIAAATGKDLRKPEIELREEGPGVEELTSVTIEDPKGCPRYAAGIIQGVKLGPSPFWLRCRLHVCGIRSINNVVDVTNYVLLETGQPLHAFDYHRLRDNRIVVKRAAQGEVFTTLDGQPRTLSRETLMICDAERSVALAGIMGGLNSEIFAGTEDVLLESAFFDPVTIRRGAKNLGLSTEASYRFERGVDIQGVVYALRRAMMIIQSLAGGRVARGVVDVYPNPWAPPEIELSVHKTNQILGTSFSTDRMTGYLRALEMDVIPMDRDVLKVVPPSFRVDVTRDVDLMEELARLDGYDNIPVTYPSIRPGEEGEPPELILRDRIRSLMTGFGFTEIITYSFISAESADILGAAKNSPLRSIVPLLNPLSVEHSVMRTSLIPGLMATLKANILHDERDLKLFEWGKVFFRKEGEQLPEEKLALAALMTGPYRTKQWYNQERLVDFYDIKGAMEALLEALGITGCVFERSGGAPGYDPEASAEVLYSGSVVGRVGRVSSRVMEAYDLKGSDAFLFDLDVEVLKGILPETRRFRPFAKFPPVLRDISIIVNRQTESSRIMDIIKREGGHLVESVQVFDLYQGEKVAPTEKSLAFRVCYRSETETLDGSEVNQLHEAIIRKIRQETGGRLKEG